MILIISNIGNNIMISIYVVNYGTKLYSLLLPHQIRVLIRSYDTLIAIGGGKGRPGGPWPLLKFKALHRNSIFAIEKF